MTEASTYGAYRYVKVNRKKKKRELNQLAMRVLFDKTSAFYLAIFGLLFAFWLRDQLILYLPLFAGVETFLSASYFGIISIAMIRPMAAALTRPGILFSSSDLFLSMLPYDQKKLWQLHLIDRLKKAAIIYSVIGLALWIMLPLSGVMILFLVVGFWLIEALMIIPQWLLYQQTWWVKLLISQGVTTIILISGLFSLLINLTVILFSLSFVLLILINITGYRRVYQITDWSNIIATNDRLLRKNILVSFASKVKIEPPKYQGFYHNVIRNKNLRKPFNIKRKNQMYNRIILIKAIEHKEDIIKLALSLIGVTVLMSILSKVTYGWAIILVIFLYSQLGSRFFLLIFEENLIFSIPWKIKKWQLLFARWLLIGFLPIFGLLALPSLYWFEINLASFMNWLSYFAISYTLLQDQMDVRAKEIISKSARYPLIYILTVLVLFFGVIYSIQTPIASILIIIYAVIRYTSQYTADKE